MSAPRDDALPDGDGPALVEAEEATSGADLYAVLGVTPAATDDEIRRAFRTQAKRWHPDRFAAGPPERRERAERRIRAVIAAYAVLNSPLRRAAYDRAHGYQFTRPPVPAGGYVRRSSTRSAEQMRAATGNPNGGELPKWPVYNAKDDQALELGDLIAIRAQINKAGLDFFDGYYHSLAQIKTGEGTVPATK